MPEWRVLLRQRLADARLPPVDELGIVEELAQHLDDCYQDHCARGASAAEAVELSLREVDGQELSAELRELLPRRE